MTEEPRPAELSRRVDELSRRQDHSFRDINARLDQMPTEKTLLALFATRDNAISALADDIRTISAALEAERQARQSAIRQVEDDRRADRKWTYGAIVTAASLALAVLGLVIGGLPS